MINRAVKFAKQHSPNSVRVAVRRGMLDAQNAGRRLTVPVVSRCEYENIYHCAVRKTASQWVKALLSDPVVYRYSGLLPHDPRFYKWRHPNAFPPGRTVTPLFISHARFETIPKPGNHRAFFVLRDPRDIVVSDYFSVRNSHTPMGDVSRQREILREMTFKEGLLHLIGQRAKKGYFKALRSWKLAPSSETVLLVRYEDLVGERQMDEVDRLMRHCGIPIPQPELTALLSRYSFSRMRSDREGSGPTSHYRKGKAGDWRNHFDDEIYEAFTAATGDLVELLGYPARDDSPGVPNG